MMLDLTPLVEPLSTNEAFMDLSGAEPLHYASPAETLAALAGGVENELSVTVSIGLGHNKFLAKITSDLEEHLVEDHPRRGHGRPGATASGPQSV